MNHHYECPSCRASFEVGQVEEPVGGKAIGCVAGLAAGSKTGNVWAALAAAATGVLVGHLIDEAVGPKCPVCAAVLKRVALDFLGG